MMNASDLLYDHWFVFVLLSASSIRIRLSIRWCFVCLVRVETFRLNEARLYRETEKSLRSLVTPERMRRSLWEALDLAVVRRTARWASAESKQQSLKLAEFTENRIWDSKFATAWIRASCSSFWSVINVRLEFRRLHKYLVWVSTCPDTCGLGFWSESNLWNCRYSSCGICGSMRLSLEF